MSLYIGSSSTQADYIAGENELTQLVTTIIEQYVHPMIGEVKFIPVLGVGDLPNLTNSGGYLVPNDSFNGWARADGSKFRKSDFPSAWNVYKTTSSTEFTVPTIADFICGSTTGLASVEQQNQVIKHQHPISYDGTLGSSSITIENGLAFGSAGGNGNGDPVTTTVNGIANVTIPLFHNGEASGGYYPVPLDVTLKMSEYKLFFGNLVTDPHYTNGGIFQPRSQRLAALIYIGKKGE